MLLTWPYMVELVIRIELVQWLGNLPHYSSQRISARPRATAGVSPWLRIAKSPLQGFTVQPPTYDGYAGDRDQGKQGSRANGRC